MAIKEINLLKTRRFLPLFLTQFLGAFNDNVYKNALVILITYTLATHLKINVEILITLAAGIFILPFFLFSATAGQLADRYEKSRLIRLTKIAEIMVMSLAGIGLYLQSISLLMLVLFLVGTQATFFGPMKYSILPDHLKEEELIAGNAFLEAGTNLAILLGTILGGILAMFHSGPILIFIAIIAIAVTGFVTSLWIPKAKIAAPDLQIKLNVIHETWAIVRHTFIKRELFLSILGISWFWLIGATYLSQFPSYAKDVLGAQSSVVTLFLTFFTIGIGIGSLLCSRLLKGKIHATYVPLAALGMTIFGIDLVLASRHGISAQPGVLINLWHFLGHFSSWRILVDLLLLAVCGGVYIVPLYAILQYESDEAFRSRAIASNNIMNALFMVVAAIAVSIMLFLDFSVTGVFLVIAIANLFVAVYICGLLPAQLIKSFLIWFFKTMYRVKVEGIENYYKAGDRVLIIANHTSFLDAALVAAFLPGELTFAIDTHVAKKRWIRFLLSLVKTFPIDPTNPMAAKSLISYLRNDHQVVIFPEGRITVTGALMKIYEGPALIADKAKANLLPVRIEGAQYTIFSRLRGKVKIHWFPKITVTILEPRKFEIPESVVGRERRHMMSVKLYDIMTDTVFRSSNIYETLFQSLLNARSIHGAGHIILEDIDRVPMTYRKLVYSSIILGRHIAKLTKVKENLGFLLPNSVGGVVTFFAMQAFHRVPAMLNFSAGAQNIILACQTAQIRLIFTSKKFIDRANLSELIDKLREKGLTVIYLEDIRSEINIFEKIYGMKMGIMMPRLYYHFVHHIKRGNAQEFAQNPAVILFTSGSEGAPKGVVLSHANLQANRRQLTARVDFGPSDRVFNALPMFHAFGLNSATLLPVISGMKVFMYPSPLHYRIIPELCYDINATMLFGTDTFLSGYAKCAHPYNFYSVRYIFAGAERLREETYKLWMQKFGVRIFEGYGATEAAPVISTNTPMQYKFGTVGRILPGMNYKLELVPDIKEGQRFYVSGPNVMLGYMFSDRPGVIVPPKEGWHDTGDIVSVDKEGYISIKGRAKRFAKIAGEMVSLTAVEESIYQLWPGNEHAILSQPDERKGEQIILITNYKNAELKEILAYYKKSGIAEIALPRKIIVVGKLPLLGSGKVDYQAAKALLHGN